jgi:hypothetical protein
MIWLLRAWRRARLKSKWYKPNNEQIIDGIIKTRKIQNWVKYNCCVSISNNDTSFEVLLSPVDIFFRGKEMLLNKNAWQSNDNE